MVNVEHSMCNGLLLNENLLSRGGTSYDGTRRTRVMCPDVVSSYTAQLRLIEQCNFVYGPHEHCCTLVRSSRGHVLPSWQVM
eukprot:gene18689-biopygen679